ncbi:hypothetical protein SAMN05660443_0263 [Marinospirillum celere]|uniref:Uncharacterized protein n=1 Tax=Marinospirillum celere TaxID=1122252 RepID=A0A1I1E2P1_9GAMM|nr:hypothetical protein [Marinospirillum celere]SFB80952.1 hypothetical protein SAMN05660443_0263 [Marinospirillum celere]
MADEYYWLQEEGGLLETESGERLLLNSGPEIRRVAIGSDFTVSDVPSGTCTPDDLLTLVDDHSWSGVGRVSLDGHSAVNATLTLQAQVEARPVASLTLGSRPEQWAWRVTGWQLDLRTSDLTQQVMQLALVGGGPLCLVAQLENQATSQLQAINITAHVVILPAQSQELLPERTGFYKQQLTGQVIGAPQIEQEFQA